MEKANTVVKSNNSFMEIIKTFWNPDRIEMKPESIIKDAKNLSEKEKDTLEKSLKSIDEKAKKFFTNSEKKSKRKDNVTKSLKVKSVSAKVGAKEIAKNDMEREK